MHPFIDGNGRAGRLLLNLVLVRLAALRQASQRGRLDAVQGSDGVWRSSRKAVEAYRATRNQRRYRAEGS
ncbi:Fic family protein [Micromonospora taraxaci]